MASSIPKCALKILFEVDRIVARKVELVQLTSTIGDVVSECRPAEIGVDVKMEIYASESAESGPWSLVNPLITVDDLRNLDTKVVKAKAILDTASGLTTQVGSEAKDSFKMMMSASASLTKVLPEPKTSSAGMSTGINQKDEIFNKLLTVFEEQSWLFTSKEEGRYVIKMITKVLWYVGPGGRQIQDAVDHDPGRVTPIPTVFQLELPGGKKAKIKLSSSELSVKCRDLLTLLDRPSMQNTRLDKLRENILNLSKSLQSYVDYLGRKLEEVQRNHGMDRPVRQISDHSSVGYVSGVDEIERQYIKINAKVQLAPEWRPIYFDEELDLLREFKVKADRRQFILKMKLEFNILVLRYNPGGANKTIVHICRVPNNIGEVEALARGTQIGADLEKTLPKFHTRAMKKLFKLRVSNIGAFKPAVLDFIYSDLTGDSSASVNPLMRKRIEIAALGEPGIVMDLRHLNPGRPNTTFDVFWEEMGKLLNEVVAADERRHGECHMSEFLSIPHIIKTVSERCPPGTKVPSTATVRLQFQPRNKFTAAATRFTSRFELQHKIQVRQLRAGHPDAHFCAAILKYMKSRACDLDGFVTVMFMDDKAKVPVGEPNCPVSTAVRTKPQPTPVRVTLNAMDHDVSSKGKLTPSVCLVPAIPVSPNHSWYQGNVSIILHDSVLETSDPYRSVSFAIREYMDSGTTAPIMMKYSDGGSEHRNVLIKVQLAVIAMFKILNLDMVVVGRCAPGQSYVNPVERVMSICNLALQNVSTSRARMDEDIEARLKNIDTMAGIRQKAKTDPALAAAWTESIGVVRELLGTRLAKLSLKGQQFKVKETDPQFLGEVLKKVTDMFGVDPHNIRKRDVTKTKYPALVEFLRTHCRQRQYLFQVRKVPGCKCCGETSTTPDQREWLPDPLLDDTGNHYQPMEELLGQETTDEDRPGLKPKFKAGKRPEKEQDDEWASESDVPLLFTSQHARQTVQCVECDKPRVIYTQKELPPSQKRKLIAAINEADFTCGCRSVFEPGEDLFHTVRLRDLSCGDRVELSYYAKKMGPQDICCHCGQSGAEVDLNLFKRFQTVHPCCGDCRNKGLACITGFEYGRK